MFHWNHVGELFKQDKKKNDLQKMLFGETSQSDLLSRYFSVSKIPHIFDAIRQMTLHLHGESGVYKDRKWYGIKNLKLFNLV